MTDFDLELGGYAQLQEQFEKMKQRGGGDAVYRVVSKADYSIYLEYGTRDMPPYPFFEPAIIEFQANPEQFVRENTGQSFADAETTNEVVEMVASALEVQIKKNATAQAPGRSPGTHPEHPQVDTGNLRAGISVQRVR